MNTSRRFTEEVDPAQPDLFDPEDLLEISPESYKSERDGIVRKGHLVANEIVGLLSTKATQIIKREAATQSLNLEAAAADAGMSVDDWIADTDVYYELMEDLADEFLQAFEEHWIRPIL